MRDIMKDGETQTQKYGLFSGEENMNDSDTNDVIINTREVLRKSLEIDWNLY